MSKKVFISHSMIDHELVSILIKFLNDIGIKNDDIFCTSINGSLEGGKNFVEQIKNNVLDSKVVIFLLSERFFLSYFCLAELGAAWALNQNILPIIVPPISTKEYNSTPLIGIQALNMSKETFTEDFFYDLVKKNVIGCGNINDKDKIFNDCNLKIKTEINTIRKDQNGFYVARLLEKRNYEEPCFNRVPCNLLGDFCDRIVKRTETECKIYGILDVEDNSIVTEHRIIVKGINLTGEKLQFRLGTPHKPNGNSRSFSVETFYEFT